MPKKKKCVTIGDITKGGCKVVKQIKDGNNSQRTWLVQCTICGNEQESKEQTIVRCFCWCKKCSNNSKQSIDYIGQRFGKLLVLRKSNTKDKYNYMLYECQCDCGNKKLISSHAIKSRGTISCGCLIGKTTKENSKKRKKNNRDVDKAKWSQLVKYIKKRDGNKCYICGHQTLLEIHHLNSWNDFVEERYAEENLITLCNICHLDYHLKYGRKTAFKREFYEYISGFEYEHEFIDYLYLYKKNNGFEFKPYIDKYLLNG